MQEFIKKLEKSEFQVEMLVDGKIFDEDVMLKAAYELVNDVYMFFKTQGDDYIVQFKLKNEKKTLDDVVNAFGEELVYHRLRKDIDQKTWSVRTKIVEAALWYGLTLEEIKDDIYNLSAPIDEEDSQNNAERSVEDIIADIENDPEFADDKDEIINILKEIK